ncbi:MAG: hypothetical protein GX935_04975 [Erysipelotrichia bacterium]|nr:hypothetical protein [Erysipelotrichia bacterium]
MLAHLSFRSWCLNTNTDIQVILPSIKQGEDAKDYYGSGKKYPVLWLLHGTLGNYTDYLRRTNIELYATENDLIVVMPSALNSNYSNWTQVTPEFRMFDFLTEELMPLIYGWFPASDKREDNFICGLSMGARGTSKYGFYWPEKFAGIACMSGVPSDIRKIMKDGPKNQFYEREMMTVNMAGGLENFFDSYENTWDLVPKVAKMKNPPKFYFCCGDQDAVYPNWCHFREYAEKVGLEAIFHVMPGYAHEWRFWEIEIQNILKFFGFKKGFKESLLRLDEKDGTLV